MCQSGFSLADIFFYTVGLHVHGNFSLTSKKDVYFEFTSVRFYKALKKNSVNHILKNMDEMVCPHPCSCERKWLATC